MVCVFVDDGDGYVVELKEFGIFKKDWCVFVEWVVGLWFELVVMESIGIYWKSLFVVLEVVGL